MGKPEAVVGIDMSLTNTGLVTVFDDGVVQMKTVKSKGTKTDDLYTRRERLHKIQLQVMRFVMDQGNVAICIESPSFNSKGGHAHDRSGLWWLVVDGLRELRYRTTQITPTQRAKYATGNGSAGKGMVIDSVARRWPEIETKGDDNLADGVVLGMMGAHHYGVRKTEMPKVNLSALEKVDWA